MEKLNLEQVAGYLRSAQVETTVDRGHALIHLGKNQAGSSFVLINDMHGNAILTEANRGLAERKTG